MTVNKILNQQKLRQRYCKLKRKIINEEGMNNVKVLVLNKFQFLSKLFYFKFYILK